ncbi:MAG: methylmalonyl-CoA mutase family protein [Lapillicoccus sp.]
MSNVDGGLKEPAGLEPEQGSLALAAPGDTADAAAWEAAAAAVLRKAHRMTPEDPDAMVWDRLTRATLDGVDIPPLGTRALLDDVVTGGRPTRQGDWDVRAHLGAADAADAAVANETLLADLTGGVTSLWITVTPETDLVRLLADVLLDLAPVTLDAAAAPVAAATALTDLLSHRGVTPASGTNLGADPLGARLRGTAAPTADPDADLLSVARIALSAGTLGVLVDATAVHDIGATDAQELGYSMAVAAAYLRTLTAAGIPLDDAVRLIEFRYAATDEQFPTIAKLRAARRLWARLLDLSGAAASTQRQHVVTSRPMMSRYDPWVNLLRTTIAAFAAGVGGADAVTVLPFDSPLGRPEAFGRRIARNTSALLVSESHVARVTDPAGGAYAVERLTDDLAAAGWAELGRIDTVGGAAAAVDDGSLAERIDHAVALREREIARRRRPITGLTEFPSLEQTLPVRAPDIGAPPVRRYGARFEALRDAPTPPPVFLATLGSVAAHTARATFATNLLAAGGIPVDSAGATSSVSELLAAYGKQPVVCLAGADAAYAEWGAEAIAALRGAGAQWVVVAGKPMEGTDDACATGVDALKFLTRTREKLT